MKNLYLAIMALVLLTFTGCQNDSPEDVAITYVKAISNADIPKAESLSTSKAKRRLDFLRVQCNEIAAESLAKESLKTLQVLNTEDPGLRKKAEEILDSLKKNDTAEKIKSDLIKKYGDPQKLSVEDRKKFLRELIERMADYIEKNVVLKLMDLYQIKTSSPKDVAKVISLYIIESRGGIRRINWQTNSMISEIAKKVYSEKKVAPTKKCISELSLAYMLNLKKVTPIETKKISADKSTVRLELVSENGKSTKVNVKLEKIQDHWKVTDFDRD